MPRQFSGLAGGRETMPGRFTGGALLMPHRICLDMREAPTGASAPESAGGSQRPVTVLEPIVCALVGSAALPLPREKRRDKPPNALVSLTVGAILRNGCAPARRASRLGPHRPGLFLWPCMAAPRRSRVLRHARPCMMLAPAAGALLPKPFQCVAGTFAPVGSLTGAFFICKVNAMASLPLIIRVSD
jgi:hypothetical protein